MYCGGLMVRKNLWIQERTVAAGAYKIWTTDANGAPLDLRTEAEPNRRPNPMNELAEGIFFALEKDPPDDQAQLQVEIDRVLGTVTRLYLEGAVPNRNRFRRHYVRLFRLAQVGLEGAEAATKQAKLGLASVVADLIDDEGLHIKTQNLTALAKCAVRLSIPFAVAYLALGLLGAPQESLLANLGIERQTLASFMVLWIGSFIGVCLSYGVRTSTFTLADLTKTGEDRLPPGARLLFIGTLTMFFGLLFVNGLLEVKIGGTSVTAIADNSGLALVIGILFGMADAVLPDVAAKKVNTLMEVLK